MQDSSAYQQVKPQNENLKCPRCNSTNTKFCYYNNYNLSQPRHLCKNCRRYWTKGGALRNIPVGGGNRKKTKRNSNLKRSSSSSSSATEAVPKPNPSGGGGYGLSSAFELDRRMLDMTGSFSSLLASNGQFGNLRNQHGSTLQRNEFGENPDSNSSVGNPRVEVQSTNINSESFLGVQSGAGDWSCWGGGNGWPDLAIFTPGSAFQN